MNEEGKSAEVEVEKFIQSVVLSLLYDE